ncbi:MAG: hypothetical protein IKY94_15060 [Lachnospiraceae bacterium]|jgi:hypothetical protein|nr:hypothetical protein [Lachnospiraceae bacterium]
MTYAENAGFFIYKDKAVLNMPSWGINNLIAYYNINGVNKEDAPCHITLTIDPENKYVKIFANGVIARANAELNFNVINNATRTYINRGLSNADP